MPRGDEERIRELKKKAVPDWSFRLHGHPLFSRVGMDRHVLLLARGIAKIV